MKLSTHWITFLTLCCYTLNNSAFASTNELIVPSLPTGCACPGDSLNYTCTVVDGSNTIWSGTAFNCIGNQVALVHSQFELGIAGGECGSLSVVGVSVTDNSGQLCYLSSLSVPVSISLNGQTVGCSRDPSVTINGSPHTLSVAGAAPIRLNVTRISQPEFTFRWTPTVNCSSVTSYEVNADMTDCGSCTHVPGTDTATCSGWTPIGQTCSVSVMSVICGGMTGEPSESLDLLLQEPNPPSVSVVPCYTQSTGSLLSLSISFPTVSPVQIVPGLTPPVTYSVQFNNSDIREFPESNCTGGVCTGTFTNTPQENFELAVIASNGLGNGQASSGVEVLSNISSVIYLTVPAVEATFTLELLEGYVGSTNLSVQYGIPGGEEMIATNSSMASEGDTLTLTLPSESLELGENYTYTLFLIHNGIFVRIKGTFSLRCQDLLSFIDPNNDVCTNQNFTGGVRIDNGNECYTETTPGEGFFTVTICDERYQLESGSSQRRVCQSNGSLNGTQPQCVRVEALSAFPLWAIAPIIVGLIIAFLVGTLVIYAGYRCANSEKGCGCKSKSGDAEKTGLTKSSTPPRAPDTLYADPNAIEHQTTATGDEYAMVEVKGKKNKKPTQQAALYQDPSAIEHETAPSGDTYAVVDKPKRGSSKKREPDVVPPGSEGLTYADVDVAASRRKPKPAPQKQAQDPGLVEYASIAAADEHSKM